MAHTFKRGDKVRTLLGNGRFAVGKVKRLYSEREIAAHARSHGEAAAARLPEWIVCTMSDDKGEFTLAHHYSSLERA